MDTSIEYTIELVCNPSGGPDKDTYFRYSVHASNENDALDLAFRTHRKQQAGKRQAVRWLIGEWGVGPRYYAD